MMLLNTVSHDFLASYNNTHNTVQTLSYIVEMYVMHVQNLHNYYISRKI